MMLELVMAGYLQCNIVYQDIVKEDRFCFYTCTDSTREFASTLKQYSCPKTLYEDRPILPFKERDFKKNKWTKEAIAKVINK